MRVIVNRQALLDVLNVAVGIAAGRTTTKEILKCVRLTTVDGGLLISATDLEVGLRGEVRQVELEARGSRRDSGPHEAGSPQGGSRGVLGLRDRRG